MLLAYVELASKAKVYQPYCVPRVTLVPPQHDVVRRQIKVAKTTANVQVPQRLHSNWLAQFGGAYLGSPTSRCKGSSPVIILCKRTGVEVWQLDNKLVHSHLQALRLRAASMPPLRAMSEAR